MLASQQPCALFLCLLGGKIHGQKRIWRSSGQGFQRCQGARWLWWTLPLPGLYFTSEGNWLCWV